MPAAVVVAVGFLAEYGILSAATAFAIGSFAATYGAAIMFVGALAYSASEARKAKSRAADQYNAAQVDRMASIGSSVAPRELVLGRVRKGGAVFFKASTGGYQKDLYLAIALAGHEIDAVETIYLNDTPVTLDGSGLVTTAPYATTTTLSGSQSTGSGGYTVTLPATYVPGTVTAGAITGANPKWVDCGVSIIGLVATTTLPDATVSYQYTVSGSNVQITTHLGAAGQTVDAGLLAAFPAAWPSTNVVASVAYLVVKFTYSETSFPSGIPAITTVMRGAKVFDPRSATTAWSQNPALLMRHVYQHAKFGKATVSAAEDVRIIAAANACDASTVYTVGGVAQPSRALYKADITAPFGAPARSLLDDLAQAMGGSWAHAGGELYLKPGTYTAPVITLTDADLAVVKRDGASESQSPIKISTHRERANKFNTVKVTIWDQAQDYKQAALTPLVGSALLARDGAELVQEVTYPAIGYAPQALHVAGVMMRDARDPLTVELPFKLSAYPVELFDTVALTLARYGWAGKTFMVLQRSFSSDGSLSLMLKETTAAIVTMDAGFTAQGFSENTNLPAPWEVASVGTLSVTSGTGELLKQADGTIVSRMRVTWAQVPDQAVVQAGQVEVQYRRADSAGAWASLIVAGNETSAATSEVLDGMGYIIRARAKTSLAVGDWGTQVAHTIVGKTAAPSAVGTIAYTVEATGIRLQWAEIADADRSRYEIRTADTGWGSTGYVAYVAEPAYLWQPQASGTHTLYVRARDTSGNYSATATAVTVVVATVPAPVAVAYTFADSSLTSASITLQWTDVAPQFGLDYYRVAYGAEVKTIAANSIELPADWLGTRTYTITAHDSNGNASAPLSWSIDKYAPNAPTNLRAQVIDNNVLLYWDMPAKTSLPLQDVQLRTGATWATATIIGNKSGGFTSLQELQAGYYTYWVAVRDTDDNYSAPIATGVSVGAPPDFVFHGAVASAFAGTKSSASLDQGSLVLPVNTTETWAAHFSSRGWTSPADQVTAGYPIFIQPASGSGYYQEVFDFGAILPSSQISVSYAGEVIAGSPSLIWTIETSVDNVSWSPPYVGTTAFVAAVRYARVKLTVTEATGTGLYRLTSLAVRSDAKLKNDAGSVAAVSSDASGSLFNFNKEFLDITSLNLTASGTSSATAVYSFQDSNIAGTYSVTSGVATINCTAHDLVVGQYVRLGFSTGGAPTGVYPVASVIDANTYTVAIATANTSGNASMYPNGARVYLFNTSGTRISGSVSWSVKGY